MDASRGLLGIYSPGRSVWHRLGVGWKYLVFLALVITVVASPSPWLSLGLVAVSLLLVASTGAPLRLAWGLPWGIVLLFGVLAAYHVLSGRWEVAVSIVATISVALYGSRLILLTTPMPVLVDALVSLARPFRRFGADPERFGLAVAVMIRSVPFVASAFGDVRDAARARGLERNPVAVITPVVIQTVAFARATGEALAARGLGEEAGREPLDEGRPGQSPQ